MNELDEGDTRKVMLVTVDEHQDYDHDHDGDDDEDLAVDGDDIGGEDEEMIGRR